MGYKKDSNSPLYSMYSISYNKYGSFHCQFQGVYFVLMAKVTIVWLTVANIWRNVHTVLQKLLEVIPQDFLHKNVNIFILKMVLYQDTTLCKRNSNIFKGTERPNKISLKFIPLDRPRIGR